MELATKPTEKEVLELQAEGFLRKNKLNDNRIDKAGDYTDCVTNADKVYVSNALVEFYLAMKKAEDNT